jgi:hypothetical protein
VINTSPEPVSNIGVSIAEDIGVIGFSYLALAYPKLTFFLTLIFLVLIIVFLPFLFRVIRMLLGAFFFRIKTFFIRDVTGSRFLSLPLSLATFFDDQKEEDEDIVWTGKAYASRIPSVRRSGRIYLVITSQAAYCLYRRWFRPRIKRQKRSEIQKYKRYPGRLLGKCLMTSSKETWVVQIYQPLMTTLPRNLVSGNEIE